MLKKIKVLNYSIKREKNPQSRPNFQQDHRRNYLKNKESPTHTNIIVTQNTKIRSKKKIFMCITVKTLSIHNKENVSKAAIEKAQVTY